MQGANAIAKAMDEATGGLLEVPHLHQRSGEVQALDVGRFPLGSLRRKAIRDHQLGPAVFRENRRIEPEPGTNDHSIVGQVPLHFVRARKAHGHVVRTVAPLDPLDVAVE